MLPSQEMQLTGGLGVAIVVTAPPLLAALLRLGRRFLRGADEQRRRAAPRAARVKKPALFPHIGDWILSAAIAGWLYRNGGWTRESVHLPPLALAVLGALLGAVAQVVFARAARAWFRARGRATTYTRLTLWPIVWVLPGAPLDRYGFVAIWALLSPFCEELFLRGILVHQLGIVLGSAWLAVGIGALAVTIRFSYLGRTALLYHGARYAVLVGLLYSPAGLAGAVGFKLAELLVSTVTLRSALREYRAARRIERRAAMANDG